MSTRMRGDGQAAGVLVVRRMSPSFEVVGFAMREKVIEFIYVEAAVPLP